MNELLQKLMGMFADKKDTTKRITNLEKNARLAELMFSDEKRAWTDDEQEQSQAERRRRHVYQEATHRDNMRILWEKHIELARHDCWVSALEEATFQRT